MKNQVIKTETRIKDSLSRLYARRNDSGNEQHIFTDKDFRKQFNTNEEGISYVKNQTFKSAPVWEKFEDRFVATTENWYYVLYFIEH